MNRNTNLLKSIVVLSIIGIIAGVINFTIDPWYHADVIYLPLHEIVPAEYYGSVDSSVSDSLKQFSRHGSLTHHWAQCVHPRLFLNQSFAGIYPVTCGFAPEFKFEVKRLRL